MTANTPNPGSAQAVELGCRCPIVPNEYGLGFMNGCGMISFYYEETCPLHCPPPMPANRCHACGHAFGAVRIDSHGEQFCDPLCIPAKWRDEDDASLGDTEVGE